MVIKLLKNPYPSFHELVQFRNQYNIAKNLHYPLIIQIYSIEAYHNAYMLVMEAFGGISCKEMGDIASLEEFLQVAIALCNILDILYRDRLQVINLLSSQAAISLENARLYQQAQQALQDLQQAQLQIVQSEKMSALGNLVAGVAHEMNNPLGFIAASLKQAKPTIAGITEHLKLYQESFTNKSEEITEHAEEIDLDYTLEDLPKIIDSMTMACDRLKNISTSLRTFSRADKDYKVPFNIHQGIDSTILILKHRLKANEQRPGIEVISNYGYLPAIECFPGQLNQVFMNILANAIDALEEPNHGRSYADIQANPNVIIIKTSLEDKQVKNPITDNGKGMN
ncbi:two-component hybrid sensor and regulator [Calothrix sp. NIES-2100]|nr:two-component hybrid sensor and regulator [Calothrix sp. NIES-2100]